VPAVGRDEELGARPRSLEQSDLGGAVAGPSGPLERSGLIRLNPHVDFPTARQTHAPSIRVGDPEVGEFGPAAVDYALSDLDHSSFDTASRNTAGDLAPIVDRHLGPERAGS
jgi:hypothetical protein